MTGPAAVNIDSECPNYKANGSLVAAPKCDTTL